MTFGLLLTGCNKGNSVNLVGVWQSSFDTLTLFDDGTYQLLAYKGTYDVKGSDITLTSSHFLHPSDGWIPQEPENISKHVYELRKGDIVFETITYTKQGDENIELSSDILVGVWNGTYNHTLTIFGDGTYESSWAEKGTYRIIGSNIITTRTHYQIWDGNWLDSAPERSYRTMYAFEDGSLVHGDTSYSK